MAIAVNSIVALVTSTSSAIQRGSAPLFGRVIGGAAPWDVLWDSGLVSASVPAAVLEEITPQAVDPEIVRYISATGQHSGYYDCAIVASYLRSAVPYRLLHAVNEDVFFEAQLTQFEACLSG